MLLHYCYTADDSEVTRQKREACVTRVDAYEYVGDVGDYKVYVHKKTYYVVHDC